MTDHYPGDAGGEDTAISGTVTPAGPGTEVATLTPAYLETLLAPFTITPVQWVKALTGSEDFPDQDAEAMTLSIMAAILGSENAEEALAVMNVQRARELCGGEPGGRSPVLEITSARPLKSTYDQGAPCYAIFKATRCDSGEKLQVTTGARAVQAFLLACEFRGWFPVKACLEIRREKTEAGYYPLNMVSGI